MSEIFKTRTFERWQRKSELIDAALCSAVLEMEQGIIDADLGDGVFKKRIALPGRGKRAGARVLVATRLSSRWIFLFGFAKNDRANISDRELRALQGVARILLNFNQAELAQAVTRGELIEVPHAPQNDEQNS